MPQFAPDQVSFNDLPGYGFWDTGHFREHQQFVTVLATQTPPIVIPAYPIFPFLTGGEARKDVLASHAQAHRLLTQAANVQGVDFSGIDLDDEGSFYDFLGRHRDEHALIRQALGIT